MEEINSHAINVDEVTKKLNTSIETGLTEEEVAKRIEIYGRNELIKEKGKTALQIFIGQFKDFLVYLLFLAIAVSIIIGLYEASRPGAEPWSSEYTDAIVIAAILITNAVLGFHQEYSAEKSLESLMKMAPHFARVRRDGKVEQIGAINLVPGDIILVEEGDKFPADIRFFKQFSLYADEALLTGESKPVKKTLDPVDLELILADRTNLGYMDTIITRGNGEGIVIGTGMNTEIGKIAGSLQGEELEPSPFQKEVDRFGKLLGILIMVICLGVFAVEILLIILFDGLVFGDEQIEAMILAFEISISLAVSAVPEGLVVVITVVMSIGTVSYTHLTLPTTPYV